MLHQIESSHTDLAYDERRTRFTRHAHRQSKQRSIPPMILDLLQDFGASVRNHGADILFFDHTAIKRLRHHLGGDRGLRSFEPFFDAYAVLADDGSVITCGHRHKRIRRP